MKQSLELSAGAIGELYELSKKDPAEFWFRLSNFMNDFEQFRTSSQRIIQKMFDEAKGKHNDEAVPELKRQ